MTLDLNLISLPDLTDTAQYPTVAHGPSCTDDGATDERTCHPGGLVRPRRYALPTEALGRLRYDLNRLRELIPIPPSIGVHCPTIRIDQRPEAIGQPIVGDTASVDFSVEQEGGDACLPKLIPKLVFPCTRLLANSQIEMGYPASVVFDPVQESGHDVNQCISSFLLKIKIPDCTAIVNGVNVVQMVSAGGPSLARNITNESNSANGCRYKIADILRIPCIVPEIVAGAVTVSGGSGAMTVTPSGTNCNKKFTISLNLAVSGGGGGSTSGGGFQVGTEADHDSPFGSDACSSDSTFPTGPGPFMPGDEVPLVDMAGVLGAAGDAMDPGTNEIINLTDSALVRGDIVDLIMAAIQPGGRILWNIVS